MNTILRDEFVNLHQSTDLARLDQQLRAHYCCKLGLGERCPGYNESEDLGPCTHAGGGCLRVRWERAEMEPPPQGELDISVVRDSPYFFS